jgi:hypothetical protein
MKITVVWDMMSCKGNITTLKMETQYSTETSIMIYGIKSHIQCHIIFSIYMQFAVNMYLINPFMSQHEIFQKENVFI